MEIISDKVLEGEKGKQFTVVMSKEFVVNAVDVEDVKKEISYYLNAHDIIEDEFYIEITEEKL
jgi:hypothetical protein